MASVSFVIHLILEFVFSIEFWYKLSTRDETSISATVNSSSLQRFRNIGGPVSSVG